MNILVADDELSMLKIIETHFKKVDLIFLLLVIERKF